MKDIDRESARQLGILIAFNADSGLNEELCESLMSLLEQYKAWVKSLSRGPRFGLMLVEWSVTLSIGIGFIFGWYSWKMSRPVAVPDSLSRRISTEYCVIHTDLGEERAIHYARFFDGFFDYFSERYFPLEQKRPLIVLLFNDASRYEAFSRQHGAPDTPFGYYMGLRRNVIVVNLQRGLGTVAHELVHHFLAVGQMNHHADWINEGIPTFFEKFVGCIDSEGDLQITFGYFSNWRFPIAKSLIGQYTLADLFQTDNQNMARSFMLFLHRRGSMTTFVRALHEKGRRAAPEAILEDICNMPLRTIEQKWKRWVANQPIDENVRFVERAFVMDVAELSVWWAAYKGRLAWDAKQELYVVRPNTSNPQFVPFN